LELLFHKTRAAVNKPESISIAAGLLLALAVPAHAAEAQAEERFDLLEIRVLGNTTLPARSVEKAVYPHLGPGRVLADVESARTALEQAYRDAGYGAVYVDIPEQQVDGGIVRLRVTEGRVDRVRVTGIRYFSNRQIRAALPALEAGEPLNLPALQGQLTALNQQTRDRSIVPVLRGGRSPGTVDIELKVEDRLPVHGNVEVSDRYTANTSRLRSSATLSFDNLWQARHSLSLQYQTAPEEPSEARVLAATYVMPAAGRDVLALFHVDTDSEFTTLGAEFNEFGVVGQGRIVGLRYIHPIAAAPSGYFHNLTLGADYKDFSEVITQDEEEPATTPISYINWTLAYAGNQRGERHSFGFDVAANFGVRGLANSSNEFHYKRFSGTPDKGEPDYFYLRGTARYERALLPWLSFATTASGQYTPHALIGNEQYSSGGADGVRGYLESEMLGDYGATGSLELRLRPMRQLAVFGFYDAAVTGLQHALPGQQASRKLAGTGLGIELADFHGLSSSLLWAYPLRDGENVLRGDSRVHFLVRYGF
jgi:hemolysin activation/secretion protein